MADLELLRLIARSHKLQDIYLDTIGEAVVLAAEQVQDKRLELIETPETVFAIDIIFDFFIGLALGGIASVLIRKGIGVILGRLLRFRAAFIKLADLELDKLTVQVVKEEIGPEAAKALRQPLKKIKKGTKDYELYRKVAETAVERTKKAIEGAIEQKHQGKFTGAGWAGDSVGVGFINAVQTNISQQKAATRAIHDELSIVVQNDAIDASLLNDLRDFLQTLVRVEEMVDLYELKTQLRLLDEAGIWSLLVDPDTIRSTRQIPQYDPGTLIGGRSLRVGEVDVPRYNFRDDLVKYWVSRFPHPGYSDYTTSFEERHHGDKAVLALIDYFRKIRSGFAKEYLNAGILHVGFLPKPVDRLVQKVLDAIQSSTDFLRRLIGR